MSKKRRRLTKKELRDREDYVLKVARIMGLKGWDICFVNGYCSRNADAEIQANPDGTRDCNLRFNKDWSTLNRQRRRHVIIHELFHLYLCQLGNEVETLEESLGALIWHHWQRGFDMSVERSVDLLAQSFGPLIDDSKFANLLPKEY